MFSSSQGGALGGGGAHPCPSCTSLPWARARALPPGGATPRRCLFSSSSLATRSPVDNVQLVQVLQRIQHLAQHVLHPLGKEGEMPGLGGPESSQVGLPAALRQASGHSEQPAGSWPVPTLRLEMGLK